ncbi:MAG: hypothetical protein R3C17_10675 [Planctomycetaceae bacterium]
MSKTTTTTTTEKQILRETHRLMKKLISENQHIDAYLLYHDIKDAILEKYPDTEIFDEYSKIDVAQILDMEWHKVHVPSNFRTSVKRINEYRRELDYSIECALQGI